MEHVQLLNRSSSLLCGARNWLMALLPSPNVRIHTCIICHAISTLWFCNTTVGYGMMWQRKLGEGSWVWQMIKQFSSSWWRWYGALITVYLLTCLQTDGFNQVLKYPNHQHHAFNLCWTPRCIGLSDSIACPSFAIGMVGYHSWR